MDTCAPSAASRKRTTIVLTRQSDVGLHRNCRQRRNLHDFSHPNLNHTNVRQRLDARARDVTRMKQGNGGLTSVKLAVSLRFRSACASALFATNPSEGHQIKSVLVQRRRRERRQPKAMNPPQLAAVRNLLFFRENSVVLTPYNPLILAPTRPSYRRQGRSLPGAPSEVPPLHSIEPVQAHLAASPNESNIENSVVRDRFQTLEGDITTEEVSTLIPGAMHNTNVPANAALILCCKIILRRVTGSHRMMAMRTTMKSRNSKKFESGWRKSTRKAEKREKGRFLLQIRPNNQKMSPRSS